MASPARSSALCIRVSQAAPHFGKGPPPEYPNKYLKANFERPFGSPRLYTVMLSERARLPRPP
eukprot:scaffold25758_cov39-Phaeocystis_antarctica.AAC.1